MSTPFVSLDGITAVGIYVSGASNDVDRAVRAMHRVRSKGALVVGDWTPAVLTFGSEGTPLSAEERAVRATEMLEHVAHSHALVFLDPAPPLTTKYAWLEAGVAWGRGLPIVVSTPGPHLPFGLSFAHHELTDEAAVDRALQLAEQLCARRRRAGLLRADGGGR